MSINKKSLRYILYTFPVFLLCIFPLIMGCLVYSINLNSRQLDTNKSLIDYINSYLPFNSVPNVDYNNEYLTLEYFIDYFEENSQVPPNAPGHYTYYSIIDNVNYRFEVSYVWIRSYEEFSPGSFTPTELNDNLYENVFTFIYDNDLEGLNTYLMSLGFDSSNDEYPTLFSWTLADYYDLVYGENSEPIILNDVNPNSILGHIYIDFFNGVVMPSSDKLGLPYWLFNYMFYVLGIFILYILFIFLVFVPKCLIALLDKSIDKLSGGNNV